MTKEEYNKTAEHVLGNDPKYIAYVSRNVDIDKLHMDIYECNPITMRFYEVPDLENLRFIIGATTLEELCQEFRYILKYAN